MRLCQLWVFVLRGSKEGTSLKTVLLVYLFNPYCNKGALLLSFVGCGPKDIVNVTGDYDYDRRIHV